MDCVHCKGTNTFVIETKKEDGINVYRRRECADCGIRFSTREHLRDDYKQSKRQRATT